MNTFTNLYDSFDFTGEVLKNIYLLLLARFALYPCFKKLYKYARKFTKSFIGGKK